MDWKTNNGPIQVKNAAGMLGVQKPGHGNPTNPHTAATEKIVADLAYLIKLPVPPVTLWDRGASSGMPQYVAVSAWAYADALTWQQGEAGLQAAERATLVPWVSAMMPFEAWISADDRQNGGNVLLGHSPSGAIGAAWIDYAFALDHVWKGNNVSGCNVPPMYPTLGAPSVDIMKAVAQSIAELERAAIEGILNRIPPSFLPRNVADSIGRNLLSRRAGVRALWP